MLARFFAVGLLSLLVPSGTAAARASTVAPAVATPSQAPQSFQRLIFHGTTRMGAPATALQAARASEAALASANAKANVSAELAPPVRGNAPADVRPAMALRTFAAAKAPVGVPAASSRSVAVPDSGFSGFSGLTHADQRLAGTGAYTNTQFSLEPPDQALCVGNGFVVEAVNNAISVYSQLGAPLTAPTPMSQLFGLAPEIVRPQNIRGPFLSDPRCYFDAQTQRWFVTEVENDTNPETGAFAGRSAQFIAVSQGADPTGAFNVLSFDTTDRARPGCPCFGDQPLIGADANGFYISTNEFSLVTPNFFGAQIYALSKVDLALGVFPTVVHIDAGALPTPGPGLGAIWYTIQPAILERPNDTRGLRGGTEYFLSALDFQNLGDNRIATWALTGTASLTLATPHVDLANVVIASELYAPPPPATQKAGPAPLGTSVNEPLELLNTNDDRMNQVVFANGRLWSGVNTKVVAGGRESAGIAYFAVAPDLTGKALQARVVQQGYVAVAGENVMFPSIGVDRARQAVLTASLSGPDFFPSAVYVPLVGANNSVRLAGRGAAPEDGFSGYRAFGADGVARWGDYSAATFDERGNVWVAAENIPDAPRTLFANWGTFVGRVPLVFSHN